MTSLSQSENTTDGMERITQMGKVKAQPIETLNGSLSRPWAEEESAEERLLRWFWLIQFDDGMWDKGPFLIHASQ